VSRKEETGAKAVNEGHPSSSKDDGPLFREGSQMLHWGACDMGEGN